MPHPSQIATGDGSGLTLAIDSDVFRPLIESLVCEAPPLTCWPPGRVSLEEKEAAASLGVPQHVLRDARLRRKLPHTRVGRTVVYTSEQLTTALSQLEANL